MGRRDELASSGRTAVLVGVDGRGVGVIALADGARETSAHAVSALHDLGVEVVMFSGDNKATAKRIAAQLGIDTAIGDVSTTRPRLPRLISAWGSARVTTSPSRPQIWC
jgi:P-type Cu2+ transporter